MKMSIQNAEHYSWGKNCDGWHLLKSGSLSVIQERMPAGSSEQNHFHQRSQQLFYILSGIATFKVAGRTHVVKAGECLHVPAGSKHYIANNSNGSLEFLVISEPISHGDRIEII